MASGLVVGFFAGYLVFGGDPSAAGPVIAAPTTSPIPPSPPATALTPGSPAGPPGASLPHPEVQARIARLEIAVLADPKNHEAWVALGNDYFDTHQAQKSVNAYAKALALKPEDPNVLTDQGVMYRHLGQFDKALANFHRANKLKPDHLQSLFNIGVVNAYDLHKPQEAAKAWNRVIALAPASPNAAQARHLLGQLEK